MLDVYSENEMETKSSNRQFTAKDIAPILMVIAFVVVNLYGKWPRLSWILLVVAVFSVILDHNSGLKRVALKCKARWDDRRTARKAFPELQEFVKHREVREQIIFLPDIGLQQYGMIRPMIQNLGGRQPITIQSFCERRHLSLSYSS